MRSVSLSPGITSRELIKHDGQPLKGGPAVTFQGPAGNLARPQYQFRQRGETGKWVSDMIPHLAELTDDIAFVHSLTSKSNTHGPAENFLSTGTPLDGFPSLGSWVTYALGSESQDLPAYVAIPDPRGVPQNGSNNWGPGFLPAAFQGTPLSSKNPIRHLSPPGIAADADRAARSLLQRMNERHLQQHPADGKLAARIASYELAARMQLSVPEITDLSSEPAHVLKSYGADDESNPIRAAFARNCILARRMIESGVRFVQLFNGAYASGGELNWDGHNKLKTQYDKHAAILDQPAAALIKDMKSRGLLQDTLIVWCTEFGRMPFFQKGAQGRDHNPDGFTCWLTGAGVKPGVSHGVTDELGQKSGSGHSSALRLQCNNPAPAWARSRATDLPAQRHPTPFDQRRRSFDPRSSGVTLSAIHNHHAEITHIGPGRPGDEQPIASPEEGVSIVGFQECFDIKVLLLRFRVHAGVQHRAGRVGGAVFAVGTAGQNRQLLPLLGCQSVPTESLIRRQNQLLIATALAPPLGRGELHGRLSTRDRRIAAKTTRLAVPASTCSANSLPTSSGEPFALARNFRCGSDNRGRLRCRQRDQPQPHCCQSPAPLMAS